MSEATQTPSVNFISSILSAQWAIDKSVGESLIPVAVRLINGEKVTAFPGSNREQNKIQIFEPQTGIKSIFGKWNLTHEIDAKGKNIHDSSTAFNGDVVTQGSVAVVHLVGPMFKRAEGLDAICGAVGTGTVSARIQELAENPDIAGIVLSIDSGGGTVDGTEELGNTIKSASKSKRVVALVDGMAGSAAYWVASQASEIQLKGNTSMVGSIGVMMSHTDISEALSKSGINISLLTNDEATHKVTLSPTQPLSEEKATEIKNELLNPLASHFHKAVLQGRAIKKEDQELAFSGRMFLAKEAIQLGLADKVGDMSSAIKSASKPLSKPAAVVEIESEAKANESIALKAELSAISESNTELKAELSAIKNELEEMKAAKSIAEKTPAAQHTTVASADTIATNTDQPKKEDSLTGILSANAKIKAKK